MNAHNPATHRRKRLRAEGFDYRTHGAYVVTICIDRMEHRLGRVVDGRMEMNEAGDMINAMWAKIPARFEAVALDAWMVMPSHIHGIVWIRQDLPITPPTLSRVVQAFKSESTVAYGRGVRAGIFQPYQRALWQRGFHDKIVRNDRMLEIERTYIAGNPGQWERDRNGN
jgi:REP element-mobilizing transposase RayT